jgi:ABC-type uncharacterized transport system substrate-binding protein
VGRLLGNEGHEGHRIKALALFICVLFADAVEAHPHVWVTLKSKVVFAADGSVEQLQYAWAFDDMYSTFLVRTIQTKQKGVYTRQDLAPLAQANVDSLKAFDYFTIARANGQKQQLGGPSEYWHEFTDGALILHLTLALKSYAKVQSLELEIYDPTYFIDIKFAEKQPVALVDAPAQCKFSIARQSWAQAANKVVVICPH